MSLVSKTLSRLGKPGGFGAACVAVAIIAAATYTQRLSFELEQIETDLDTLETQRASVINDIESLTTQRNEVFDMLRAQVVSGIASGVFDAEVDARAKELDLLRSATAETSKEPAVPTETKKVVKGTGRVNV